MTEKGSSENRTERLIARISSRQKQLLKRAADLKGQSLNSFILSVLQEAAERVIREQEVMELSVRDSKNFVEALLNPPEPNFALKSGLNRYNERS